MTKEDYRAHWLCVYKETSLSFLGLNFSHYMRACILDCISHFHALKVTLLLHHSLVLERWAQGLSVMLQKMFGCLLIIKLRAILLMEVDFSSANKTIYGIRMLERVRSHNLMPEEIFIKRNKIADDGTLTKVLTYDIIQ
jgi:hypothetical protein